MKAMILAAGKGERLLPLTQVTPKPLFPVANWPIIRYNIEFLKHYGFTEIIINVFHLAKQLEQELGDGSAMGARLSYSYEEELWGTGGGLKQVEKFFADEETFVVMNADVLIDFDLEDALHFHKRNEAVATMVLTREASIKTYGAVDIDEDSRVRNIAGRIADVRESDRISAVFTGVHILSPKIFEYIPPNINSCINAYAYPKMIQNKEHVQGYLMEGYWADIGRPETYFQTTMNVLDRKVRFRHYDPLASFTLKPNKDKAEWSVLGESVELGAEIEFLPPFMVGHNVRIGDKAKIGPYTVIGDGTVIGKNAVVSDSIIFPGCKVGNRQKVMGAIVNKKKLLRVSQAGSKTQTMEAVADEPGKDPTQS
jgi:NDP-sugar pyrophosphorylase family protein